MPKGKHTSLLAVMQALSDPARLQIMRLLKQRGCCSIGKSEGMCACDIERRMKQSQPTISHHMNVLRRAGLVEGRRHGKWMWYRRNQQSLRMLRRAMANDL